VKAVRRSIRCTIASAKAAKAAATASLVRTDAEFAADHWIHSLTRVRPAKSA
jgi:hypothetical protein